MPRVGRSAATQTRILDAAERMIADHGIDGTSMRALTAIADVNLAAVNYHFGSKDGLVVAVLERRMAPVDAARRASLAAAQAGGGDLDRILAAWLAPLLAALREPDGRFAQVFHRILVEPGGWLAAVRQRQRTAAAPWIAALTRLLPGHDADDLMEHLHFAAGALAQAVAAEPDASAACDQAITFLAARLRDGEDIAPRPRR
jgi:AcrR family transcriptional regulator